MALCWSLANAHTLMGFDAIMPLEGGREATEIATRACVVQLSKMCPLQPLQEQLGSLSSSSSGLIAPQHAQQPCDETVCEHPLRGLCFV